VGAVSDRNPATIPIPNAHKAKAKSEDIGTIYTGQLLSQENFLTFSNTVSIEMIRRGTPNRKRRSGFSSGLIQEMPANAGRNAREIQNAFRHPTAIPAASRTIIGEIGGKTWKISA
jgi:hypothetical protein